MSSLNLKLLDVVWFIFQNFIRIRSIILIIKFFIQILGIYLYTRNLVYLSTRVYKFSQNSRWIITRLIPNKYGRLAKNAVMQFNIFLSLFILLIIFVGIIIYITPSPPPYIEHLPLGTRIRLRIFDRSNTATGLFVRSQSFIHYTYKQCEIYYG